MQNLRLHSANVDLARHEKHSVRTVVPLGSGSTLRSETESPASLLEEERFFSRLLSRESSIGFSSRAYYRAAGKVPFEWEIAPGKPKNPSEKDDLPPLSPPPLVTHHLFPRNPRRERSRFWFLKPVAGLGTKKAPGGSRRCNGAKAASFGDLGGVTTTTSDYCQFDFPTSQKDFRWSGFGRIGCFPFDLTRIFSSDRGRRM